VLVSGGDTTLLIDAGLNLKETRARMASLGLDAASVQGVLITHEHADHVAQAGVLARNLETPVWISEPTRRVCERWFKGREETPVLPDRTFRVGALEVTPVRKQHDAVDPSAFLISFGEDTLGVFTDLGHVEPVVGEAMGRCTVLVSEANHDPDMLSRGPYPERIKRRVGGALGHLSNDDAARAIARYASPDLRCLVLGHLSRQNNHPSLVREAFVRHLGERTPYQRWLSYQERATPLFAADGAVIRKATSDGKSPSTRGASSGVAATTEGRG